MIPFGLASARNVLISERRLGSQSSTSPACCLGSVDSGYPERIKATKRPVGLKATEPTLLPSPTVPSAAPVAAFQSFANAPSSPEVASIVPSALKLMLATGFEDTANGPRRSEREATSQ